MLRHVSFAKISVVRQLLCILPLLVTACGGGGSKSPPPTPANPSIDQFTSDKSSYFVGDRAQLTAVYSSGTARIQPGDIAIASGQMISTPTLTTNTTHRLEVVGNGNTAIRELAVTVSYHDRKRAIAVPFARTQHIAVRLNDGRVLVVGGRDESKLVARQMYVFDPSSEAFTAFGSIVTSGPFGSVAVTLADGNVLLVGGIPASAFSNAVLINAQTGAVTPTSSQPHSRRVWGTGTRLADGKVLFVGGLLATGDDGNAIEISTTADPTAEAAALADSRVLAAGGAGDLFPTRIEQSSELIDTTTKLRIAGPQMSATRYSFTMTPLSNGKVLILGGLDQDGNPMASAEIYE